jgi:hypothetical protein
MTNCDCQKSDCNCGSSSGFIFGLILGAVIGAVIAVIIYKNNKTEVFEKLEQKIKSFFENLIPQDKPQKTKTLSKKVITKKEITPVFVKPKKSAPKTFIKPKK